ncbi:MAG: hypothetical protein J6K52_05770 [Clostridia bacterium]|nr:hypothetical protein [Clostridia bacterium]
MAEEEKLNNTSLNKDAPSDNNDSQERERALDESIEKQEKREKRGKLIGKIISICFSVALFAFIGALLIRIYQSDYKALEETYITDNFKEAYEKSQDVRTHATNDQFSKNGAIYTYSLVYIPKSGYLQLTVRYNKLHIDDVKEACPDFSEDDIFYTLTDKTGKTYEPILIDTTEKFMYKYFKFEFVGVNFNNDDITVNMFLDGVKLIDGDKQGDASLVPSKGDKYNSGMVVIHSKDNTHIPYEFSSDEKEELGIKD